jgi:hypothetical protein
MNNPIRLQSMGHSSFLFQQYCRDTSAYRTVNHRHSQSPEILPVMFFFGCVLQLTDSINTHLPRFGVGLKINKITSYLHFHFRFAFPKECRVFHLRVVFTSFKFMAKHNVQG